MAYIAKESLVGQKRRLKEDKKDWGGTFEKGTIVEVTGCGQRGYDIKDEFGNVMYECGFDIFEDEEVEEKTVTKEVLEETILNIAAFFEDSDRKKNAEFIAKLNDLYHKNEKLYEVQMHIAFHNFSRYAALAWLEEHPNVKNGWDKFFIECCFNGLLEFYLDKVIEAKEGTPCSSDKAHFIIRTLKEAIATNQNISLYVTYAGQERIEKEDWDKQAYWSPKSFKDTDDVKEQFKKWYNVV